MSNYKQAIPVKCVSYTGKPKNDTVVNFFYHCVTPEICMVAVTQNGMALQFITDQTPELCMAAVTQNGLALEHVDEQTPELCMAAVKQNGMAFGGIKIYILD